MTVTKPELRERALEARRGLSPVELADLSARVAQNLSTVPEFRKSMTLATYVAKEDEVHTAPIIERALKEGKRVVVPLTQPSGLLFFEIGSLDGLAPGNFGVLEPIPGRGTPPIPLNATDVVLVPLAAWDDGGNRIGYGKGYFDAALRLRGASLSIGLALEVQRVEGIPATTRDVPLDVVVTELRVVRFPNAVASRQN
ncbi:MAG: 5-formyltetrahydrofolate cyclo-ligase [Thaumarchaeota archaeon]|nr:5-formyltetrahydrofolate cyclo-ligase [Nitrososphaerota archaeon]